MLLDTLAIGTRSSDRSIRINAYVDSPMEWISSVEQRHARSGCRQPTEPVGTAVHVTDESGLRDLADLWRTNYHGDWDFTVEDWMFHQGGGSSVVFEVAPTKVLAVAKGVSAQTRYGFD